MASSMRKFSSLVQKMHKLSVVTKPVHFGRELFLCGLSSKASLHEPEIPSYQEKVNEPMDQKRARLVYQSRKRGMLENCLILSTFAAKYVKTFDENELKLYDRLINLPSDDWEIYYWATGVKPTPEEFNNEVMNLLKEHVRNPNRETRFQAPPLY